MGHNARAMMLPAFHPSVQTGCRGYDLMIGAYAVIYCISHRIPALRPSLSVRVEVITDQAVAILTGTGNEP